MVRLALCVAVLAGCYSPAYRDCEVTCASGNGCPSGLSCENAMCRVSGHGDACGTMGGSDSGIDGTADANGDAGDDAGTSSDVIAVAAQGNHTCAACGDGSLWCWGANEVGESSGTAAVPSCSGNAGCNPTPTHVALPGSGSASVIGLGMQHSCVAYGANGQLACWGSNASGQFGTGTTVSSNVPIDVTGRTATAISGGSVYNCFVMAGQVYCSGNSNVGQLGDGTLVQKVTPTKATGVTSTTVIAAGDEHACVINAGAVDCWGGNTAAESTGTGSPTPATQLVPVSVNIASPIGVAVGDQFSCAVNMAQQLKCWGSNQAGQYGLGAPSSGFTSVTTAQTGVTHAAAGGAQLCWIKADGQVACAGALVSGQSNAPLSIALPAGRMAMAIAAGNQHACAILDDRSLICWGANDLGQVGNGTHGAGTMTPSPINICR